MSCNFSSKIFKRESYKLISPFLKQSNSKESILDSITTVSRSINITDKDLSQAVDILKEMLSKTQYSFSNQELIGALTYKDLSKKKSKEDVSSKNLSKNVSQEEEDVFETFYGMATYPKMQAKLHLNLVGINSILYDEFGVFNDANDINNAIQKRQEELLLNILEYLKSTGVDVSKLPSRMYKNGRYTGIMEKITMKVSPELLMFWYNNKEYKNLKAYSSYVILSNFDHCIKKLFGKAISINPDANKYQIGKYSIAGGSNVFNTWRTSEEINLGKEINNITQAIVTSIPYISQYGDTQRNLKFSEFCYIISKIKDLPVSSENDFKISIRNNSEFCVENLETMEMVPIFSKETVDLVEGKSFLELITNIRWNPQLYIPAILELMNNDLFTNKLIREKVIDNKFLLLVDKDIINSVYQGLFNRNNSKSLLYILELSSYDKTNYFAFIAQTIDSIYKAGFLQYFINPDGQIYVRNLYDLSISNIEYNIKDSINSINSALTVGNYAKIQEKYNIRVSKYQENINGENKYPLEITLNVNDLEIKYNLADGKIHYYESSKEIFSFSGDSEYKKYADFIQDILKLHLDVDLQYMEAYKALNPLGQDYTKSLFDTSVRVVINQYLSNTILKDKTKLLTKVILDKLFPISTALHKPKYDNRLKEIGFITDADIGVINILALAKALVTGRLTSSQILDSEGNALAASTLSRLVSTLPYLIQQQIKNSPFSAANHFLLWKPGVYKGIYQLKELKNNLKDVSKSHTEFSAEEMEQATVFVDFLQGLLSSKKASTSPLGNGLVCFYPSENSDKTYAGRMIIDLNKITVTLDDGTQTSLYYLIKSDPSKISEFLPVIRLEFQTFYNKALENINKEWKRLGDYVGLNISYNDWSSVNIKSALEGKTPLQWVNEKVTEYNNEHPFNPITLTDQVHYVEGKKGTLTVNKSLLENVKRFNDDTEFRKFLYDLSEKTLQSILDDGLNVPSNPDIEKTIGKDWIDKDTNNVILGKAFREVVRTNSTTGEEYIDVIPLGNIRSKKDFELFKSDPNVEFELNPLIDCYNKLNFFFTLEFMNSTVGAYYAHPSKDKTGDPLNDEISRKAAQDKRNVSFTASMHSYLHNLILGVPDVINMAIMPDVKDVLLTISGETFEIKNFDGATFENPFFGRMINRSLCGALVGKNKKTFIHYYDEKTGTGGIVKTADYCLSNYEIRESKFYQVMMQNMTDRVWRKKDGSVITDINVLLDYKGNVINLGNPDGGKAGLLYFRDNNGRNFAILKINYLGNNLYSKTVIEVDNEGNAINDVELQELTYTDNSGKQITSLFYKNNDSFINLYDKNLILSSDKLSPIVVNTNYKLWKMFGGERALELRNKESGKQYLEWSEYSLDLVANIMNSVGYLLTSNPKDVKYQSDIWLPLKHSDIHIMPTVGAVKQGAANINEKSAYSLADSSKINFMRIRLDLAGILLDKEHNANGEELSIMTQVLSACAARGYTLEKCEEMYLALAAIARSGIKEYLDAFEEFFKIDVDPNLKGEEKLIAVKLAREKYQKTILDILINSLKNSTNDSVTLQIITQEVLKKAREGEELLLIDVCYSDPAVYNKLHSTLSVAITRAAIKIKVDGILSVLCPTYNVRKIYGGKTLSAYNNDSEIIAEQEKLDKEGKTLIWESNQFGEINKLSNIRLGRHYLVTKSDGSKELRYIRTHTEYYAFRDEILGNGEIISVKELFAPIPELGFEGGRELASYNATFRNKVNAVDPQLQSLPTGSEIRAELEGIKDWNKKLLRANELGLNIDISEIYNDSNIYYHLASLPKITPESFRKETGYSTKDQLRIISMLASKEKGGMSIEKAAETIYLNLPENLKYQYSDIDIRSMIIELFGIINTPNDIIHYSEQQAIDLAISNYDSLLGEALSLAEESRSFNIYDLQSVKELADLKELIEYQKNNGLEITVSKSDLNNALAKAQRDLNILSNLKGDINITKISEKTEAFNVEISNGSLDFWSKINHGWQNINPDGIVAYRKHGDKPETFSPNAVAQGWIGNPFSTQSHGLETVLQFYDWIVSGKLPENVDDETKKRANEDFRQAIIQKLLETPENSPILYYTELNYPSHATVIGYLILNKHLLKSKNCVKLIDGSEVEIDPDSVEIEPYEIIMPKIFAEVFGLDEYDDLESIKSDPDFFTKRLIEKLLVVHSMPTKSFSIGLMRMSGKHVYLLNSRDAVETDTFKKKQIQRVRENGKLYRVINDEKVYRMNDGDEVWEQTLTNGTTVEVIVTNDIKSYIDKLNYNTLFISENTYMDDNRREEMLNYISRSKNISAKKYIYALEHSGLGDIDNIESIQYIHLDNENSLNIDYFKELGKEIYTSFIKSLDYVAARVPALSMLSFMPMRVVAFEAPDINTAYVGSAQFLFQGSDLDIDAVSLASFAFTRDGKYIMHSPYANISSISLLKASENIPFPTGKILPVKNTETPFNWGEYISYDKTVGKPFYVEKGKLKLNNDDVLAINKLSKLIRICNRYEFIPGTFNTSESAKLLHKQLADVINEHNNYINTSDNVELFSKNYVVSSMYDIGLSPANLIESLQAMDSITAPLKDVANNTDKALVPSSSGNVANFTTNIRGFILNMAGKKGVGICAVGLKSFFGLTARYNEVLNNGTPEEIERLKSNVEIEGKRFRMLANTYTKSEVAAAILGEVLLLLDLGQDQALVLSALLSLATDNAKELALDKLNASNMLGMYIYGISIGCDFKTLADIIASPVGIEIDRLLKGNSFSERDGISNINKVFEYLELGPILTILDKTTQLDSINYGKYLTQEKLRNLAWNNSPVIEKINLLESLKHHISDNLSKDLVEGTVEYNRTLEKALEYVRIVDIIKLNFGTYEDFKKLNEGAEELRIQGQLFHVNLGLETLYSRAMGYISTVTGTISTRQYSEYRKKKITAQRDGRIPEEYKPVNEFNFHQFVSNKSYREACIDLYGGYVNMNRINSDSMYKYALCNILNISLNNSANTIMATIEQRDIHKVFFNILDSLLVPHYMSYLEAADLLHQMMMSSSVKYRTIYNLGKKAINILGIFTKDDKESVFKRTELFVDRLMRDRFLIQMPKMTIPEGEGYFVKTSSSFGKRVSDGNVSILLGTREGNASFKLLMETKIIPDLMKEIKNENSPIFGNEFIKSLEPKVYKNNPQYSVTVGWAPGINMSPRSDNDVAVFERIKYSFNLFRSTSYRYNIGNRNYDLIELFWIYNQIAFHGRPGENTLTNIFQNVQDYRLINLYRNFISQLDKEGNFEETVSVQTLAREVALRSNPYNTTMRAFYYEDPITGELSWFEKEKNSDNYYDENMLEERIPMINGFSHVSIFYAKDDDLKNYFVNSLESDLITKSISTDKGTYTINIQKGLIDKISFTPKNTTDVQDFVIPIEYRKYFKKIPTKSLYTVDGFKSIYDIEKIKKLIENIEREQNCSL